MWVLAVFYGFFCEQSCYTKQPHNFRHNTHSTSPRGSLHKIFESNKITAWGSRVQSWGRGPRLGPGLSHGQTLLIASSSHTCPVSSDRSWSPSHSWWPCWWWPPRARSSSTSWTSTSPSSTAARTRCSRPRRGAQPSWSARWTIVSNENINLIILHTNQGS